MKLSLLNLEKVRPPIHTPRFSARFRTQGSNTPHAGSFKNPFLGLELNFIRQIQDIEAIHKPTNSRKKKVIFNVIEDIANLDYGFHDQVFLALNVLRPPEEREEDMLFQMTSTRDLLTLKTEFGEITAKKDIAFRKVNKLKMKISKTEKKNAQLLNEIHEMKEKLMNENQMFEREKALKQSFIDLQREFDSIFNKNTQNDDIILPALKLQRENDQMRKDMLKLRYQLDIAMQITRRLKIQEDLDE